jgi:hypothetical protein
VQLVTLDAHLDDIVLEYAARVLAAQAAHEAAATRAKDLGLRFDLPTPSLEDAQFAASKAARMAREQAGRDCLSDWLAPEAGAGDWRLDGLSPAEVALTLAARDRATAESARHEVAATVAAAVHHATHLVADDATEGD